MTKHTPKIKVGDLVLRPIVYHSIRRDVSTCPPFILGTITKIISYSGEVCIIRNQKVDCHDGKDFVYSRVKIWRQDFIDKFGE